MKIILSSDEIAPALEKFKAEHDPDNALSLRDIIENYQSNQAFIRPLLLIIMRILFTEEDNGLGANENDIADWLEYTFSEEIFMDNLIDIGVLGESCDIVLTFKHPNM
jgi:hypothetical protein